jgi:tRNA-Thr(GGU) m(6)t(6)A37 methyltransferase TsaA
MSGPAREDSGKRAGEQSVELPSSFDTGIYFIGRIRTPWKTRAECPKNGRLTREICTVELDPRYAAALDGLEQFPRIVVMYFMDQARRDLVRQVPRHLGEPRGTFALRSPVRPNPIALSVVELVKIEGNRLSVIGLDCLDGTPLVDLKPHYETVDGGAVQKPDSA